MTDSYEQYVYLQQLTMDKLLELLAVAPIPASSPEDEAYVEALEEAIIKKENINPTGFLPDADQQWAEFQKYYNVPDKENTLPEMDEGAQNVSAPEHLSAHVNSKPPTKFRQLRRTLLTAAALVVFILAGMIAAQAAGIDVFGAFARWTEDTFSFGPIRTEGAEDALSDLGNTVEEKPNLEDGERVYIDEEKTAWLDPYTHEYEFSSLQAALDAYHITEVTAPTWIPEEFTLEQVLVVESTDPESLVFLVTYKNGEEELSITIDSYTDEPATQVEKNDQPPEIFEVAGTTFYLIENSRNYAVAWYTDHYECYIGGLLAQKENLKKMVYSMFE